LPEAETAAEEVGTDDEYAGMSIEGVAYAGEVWTDDE